MPVGQHFSLDILVIKLSELFQSKAFCQILRLVLMLVEEILVLRLLKGRGAACPCGGGRWTLNGSFSRSVRTSLGTVSLPFTRECQEDGEKIGAAGFLQEVHRGGAARETRGMTRNKLVARSRGTIRRHHCRGPSPWTKLSKYFPLWRAFSMAVEFCPVTLP